MERERAVVTARSRLRYAGVADKNSIGTKKMENSQRLVELLEGIAADLSAIRKDVAETAEVARYFKEANEDQLDNLEAMREKVERLRNFRAKIPE
ncbi:hypothetical protein [Azospirillum doebereinerae]|uniref:Uncharacterized protein n=1 Tax=Azospirillum doebereinerae TaxID=92933 RepID=A0A433J2W2_9PROT|nr:hypothetical protein [Azospirillum doebereinerae]RUQ66017.1 hypothetical protein EJ913_24580 [Azospirillum doebereinerae]